MSVTKNRIKSIQKQLKKRWPRRVIYCTQMYGAEGYTYEGKMYESIEALRQDQNIHEEDLVYAITLFGEDDPLYRALQKNNER